MKACICGADSPCDIVCLKHGRVLHGYPCEPCHQEWVEKNPHTSAAIGRLASGKGSIAAVTAAQRKDAK